MIFNDLIDLLDKAVNDFGKVLPGIQQDMLDRLRVEIQGLDTKRGNITVSGDNLRKIASIKNKLQAIILTPEYKDAVKQFAGTYTEIIKLQNQYFNSAVKEFTQPEIAAELRKQSIAQVVNDLTESGLQANVIAGIEDILHTNITTGGSLADMTTQLQNNLLNNDTGEGSLVKYANQITTDSIHQYSAQYTQLVSNDLGLEWFIYSGSNIETSRPFCIACTKKKYIHVSEIPALLRGDFPEFREADGKLNSKTGLPAGMYPDTTASNFQIRRGGYRCGHQLRPVNTVVVPQDVKDRIGR